jgi:hypothetical protein
MNTPMEANARLASNIHRAEIAGFSSSANGLTGLGSLNNGISCLHLLF